MTKEECIALLKRYAEYNGMGIQNLAGCRDAMRTAAELLQQPSLPSNLDEAANTFGFKETLERLREGGITRKNEGMFRWQIEKAFKAGAEWMAGQGVSLSHLIAWYIQSIDAHEPVWTKEHLEELVKDYILIPKN